MSNQNAIQDDNQVWALTAHSGTAVGTATTAIETRQIMGSNGNLHVDLKAGTVAVSGTLPTTTTITGGTLNVLEAGTVSIAGTVPVSQSGTWNVGITGTTPVNVISGTTNIAGTVPVSGTVNTLRGLSIPPYDTVQVSYPSGTTETYLFKSGGTAGATVATVNLTYTDSLKGSLSLVLKT